MGGEGWPFFDVAVGSVADRSAVDPAFTEAIAGGGRTKGTSNVGCFSRAAISDDVLGVGGRAGCGILRALVCFGSGRTSVFAKVSAG